MSVAVLALLTFVTSLSLAAANNAQDRMVVDLMAAAGIPGMEAAVVTTGHIVWEKSFGDAVLDVPGPRKSMAPNTLLDSGSMGKLLVTVAALQLVEKGHISLNDDIDASLPFVVRNPAWPDVPITWRMLLTHTASLNDESDDILSTSMFYGRDPTESLEDFVLGSFEPAGAHHHDGLFRTGKPGTERIYNNLAFDLIALAVQRLVGEPFDRHVDRAILKPLGMTDSSYLLARQPADRLGVGYASLPHKDHSYSYKPANAFLTRRPR